MFKYSNLILVNSLKDFESGLDKFQTHSTNPKVPENTLRVLRVNDFKKDNVLAVYKRMASDPVLGTATFNLSGTTKGELYRLYLYIRLSGSQNSYYSNDFVFKGKPFVFEFVGGDSDADTAKNMADSIKLVKVLYGDKFVTVSVSGATVVVKCTSEYQLMTIAKIQKFDNSVGVNGGEFVDMLEGKVIKSEEGFGTYSHILKDLRLPTLEARRFAGINQEELPAIGAKYNQYVIEYCTKRGVLGSDAVGQLVKSKTTHVFYINQSIADVIEPLIATLTSAITEITGPLSFTVDAEDLKEVEMAGETKTVTPTIVPAVAPGEHAYVSANTAADWITPTPGEDSVQLVIANNGTSAVREADVEIIVTYKGVSRAQTVKVSQKDA